jgi:tetratricopeptide (TPR) repeat protein
VTRPLFEQYKEALRKGHLAARAGKIDAALAGYAEAARLAPDRAAPHTSSATALHRAGRSGEAQAAFERALAIAPDDEATLRARAVVYEEIGRSASAAADLERLAEALEAGGRRADALAAARHAVALTATPGRRLLVARLDALELGPPIPAPAQRAAPATPAAPPSKSAREAQPREAQARDAQAPRPAPRAGSTATPPIAARPTTKRAAPARPPRRPESAVDAAEPIQAPVAEPAKPAPAGTPATAGEPTPTAARAESVDVPAPAPPVEAAEPPRTEPPRAEPPRAGPSSAPPAEQAAGPPAEPSIPWPAVDLPSPPPPMPVGPPPNVDTLMADATTLIDRGDLVAARNLMLTAVAVHRAAGHPDAALDVCLQILALAPGDAYVHLAIAGLQLDRGWRTLATEKIALLLRLTALTGDTQAEADVHALAAERVRDEPQASVGTH